MQRCSLFSSVRTKFVKLLFAAQVTEKVECLITTIHTERTVQVQIIQSKSLKIGRAT